MRSSASSRRVASTSSNRMERCDSRSPTAETSRAVGFTKRNHPDRIAGMLFMSEEGTEQGGLILGASQLPDGTIENHGHLSLDQYEENQIFALRSEERRVGKECR